MASGSSSRMNRFLHHALGDWAKHSGVHQSLVIPGEKTIRRPFD